MNACQKAEAISNLTTHFHDYVLFADSRSCVAAVGRKNCETKVRIGGCKSSRMIIRALIRVLGKIISSKNSNSIRIQ